MTAAPNTAGVYDLSLTFTVSPGATWALIRLYNGATSTSTPVYWDKLMIVDGAPTGNYADGSTPGWLWNGTANSSTSTGSPQ